MARKHKTRSKKGNPSIIRAVSVSLLGGGLAGTAMAAPSGAVVVNNGGGTVDIAQLGNEMTITQSAAKAIINWNDFSISADELVRFAQQAGNDSVTLNRVTGASLSQINGILEANGNIFIVNPNGIAFGAGSSIDVAGLLATTLSVSDDDFMRGTDLAFTSGGPTASITNAGNIEATGGFVYLIAPNVDNSGHVIANIGQVRLTAAGGFKVDLSGNNLVNFSVTADALGAASEGVRNSGTLDAQSVLLSASQTSGLMSSVVNNSGVIEATSLDIAAAGIVQDGSVTAGTATLTATDSLTTGVSSSTAAGLLNLEVTADGASLGAADNALRIDAGVLNARAANGHVVITDVAGGVALGEVTTGNKDNQNQRRVILRSEGGDIVSANPGATNVTGWSANLVADGAIGSDGQAINTNIDVLTASTQNGGINIADQDGDLLVGAITAREAITVNGLTSGSGAISDAEGNIRLTNGAAGTRNVSISAREDLFLSGSIGTGNRLNLTAEQGNVFDAGEAVQLTGREINLSAGQGIALSAKPLNVQSEVLNATAQDGSIYLAEGKGLTLGSVSASRVLADANDVSINVAQGNLRLGSIEAAGGTVSLNVGNGAISDNNAGAMNVSAEVLNVVANNAVGTTGDALETAITTLGAETKAAQAGVYLSNDRALDSLTATTSNGDVRVDLPAGQFAFNRSSSLLSLSGGYSLDVSFTNKAGSIVVDGLDLGSDKQLMLSTSGAITQGLNGLPLVAGAITLDASGNLGAEGQALRTRTGSLDLTSRNGIINVDNAGGQPLSLTASATGTTGAVTLTQQGDLVVESVSATTAASLTATGQVLGGSNPSGIHVTAGGLTLAGASIGQSGQALASNVTGPVSLASAGDIHYQNTGAISLLDASAAGRIVLQNGGDVTLGHLQAGDTLTFAISGKASDGNGAGVNFTATGLDIDSRAFGSAGDALELHVDSLTIDTVSGGIYAVNANGSRLALVHANSGGTGSDIRIESAGDIDLGSVNAGGNNVTLKSGGAIEDARSDDGTPNVVARSLDISAPGGIGLNGDLDLDVSFLSAAGGAGGVKASNAGAIAVDSSSLTGKGLSQIAIIASDITVLDNSGGTITMDGGSLTLTATSGNIVFLNRSDTLYLPGGGNITLTAMGKSDLDGYNGAIVVGNLKTDNGGDIRLQAESNITIGMLDAGHNGDVAVLSRNGIILDGNGSQENIVGDTVTLLASTPSFRDAELSRDTAIADYAAKVAEANAKLFDLQVLIQQLQSYEAQVVSATTQKQLAASIEWLTQLQVNAQQARVDQAQDVVNGLNTALQVATVIRNAAAFVAGAAQAIPFSGDAGADAIFAGVDVAMSAASLALDSYERYSFAPMAAELDSLNNQLDLAMAVNVDATTNLNMATVIRDTVLTSKQMADLAVFKANTARDASQQIRLQAVAAYDLRKDIDSSADKPLGITANRLDVNQGGTLNTSLYLDTQGHLGLGDISVALGEQIIAKAAQDLRVVGNVFSDTRIEVQAGNAIQGAGGTLVAPDLKMVAGNGIGTGQSVNTQVDRLAASAGSAGVALVNRNAGSVLTVGTQGAVQGISGAGDISLDTDGDLKVDALIVDTTASHTVSLTGSGAVIDGNGPQRNVQGGRLVVRAGNRVELDTEVSEMDVQVSGSGAIALREATSVLASHLVTADGDIALSVGNAITVGALAAGGGADDVSLTAGGQILDDQNNATRIVADRLSLKASSAIGAVGAEGDRALDTQVSRLSAEASGEVNVHEVDDLTVERVETDQGNVTLASQGGSLSIDTVSTGTGSDTITLVAAQAIANARTDAASNLTAANLAMFAGSGIGAAKALNLQVERLEAQSLTGGVKASDLDGDLTLGGVTPNLGLPALSGVGTGEGDIDVRTTGNLVVAEGVANSGTGGIALTAGGSLLQNADIEARNGNLSVTAGTGDLTMADGSASRTLDGGDIAYGAGGDLRLTRLTAVRDVQLNATLGAILAHDAVTPNVTGRNLQASAAGGIGSQAATLQTRVERIVAQVTGSAGAFIDEADGVQLSQASAGTGPIQLRAGGDIAVGQVQSGGNLLLASAGGIATLADGLIGADGVQLNAATGINVATQAGALAAEVSGSGDLRIIERDALALQTLVTADGDILVSAGGDLGVTRVQAGAGTDDVRLLSAGAIQNQAVGEAILARQLDLTAASGIGNGAGGELKVTADRLALRSAAGDVLLSQSKAVVLDELTAGNGNARFSVLAGDATVATLAVSGNAELNVAAGALLDDGDEATRLAADALTLNAASGIAVQTRAGSLAAATAAGDLVVDELDGLRSLTTRNTAGDTRVRSASGNIGVASVEADGRSVLLQATRGAIRDADTGDASSIDADRLQLEAATGIGLPGNALDVRVNSLAANGGTGGAYIRNLSAALNLASASGTALRVTGGDLVLSTAGTLALTDAVVNSGGGSISLTAGGNIAQQADIAASGRGNVALASGGSILMADVSTTSGSGNISYTAQDTLSVSTVTTSSQPGGGRVTFVAPKIIDNMPGVGNVQGWMIDVDSRAGGVPLVKELIGEDIDTALVRLGYRPLGGNLADSRRIMDQLFQPAAPRTDVSVSGSLLSGLLTNTELQTSGASFREDASGNLTFGR